MRAVNELTTFLRIPTVTGAANLIDYTGWAPELRSKNFTRIRLTLSTREECFPGWAKAPWADPEKARTVLFFFVISRKVCSSLRPRKTFRILLNLPKNVQRFTTFFRVSSLLGGTPNDTLFFRVIFSYPPPLIFPPAWMHSPQSQKVCLFTFKDSLDKNHL